MMPLLSDMPVTSNAIITRDCPLCGTDNSHLPSHRHAPAEWPMKQCRICDMVYLEKAWSLDMLYEEYDWEKSATLEDIKRNEMRGLERRISKRFRRIRNRLLPRKQVSQLISYYAPAGNILDVGSGAGDHLLALPMHYIPHGIEISSQAVRRGSPAIEARGGKLVNKDALGSMQHFADNFFSGIIMRSFLEHDIRPKEIMLEAQRILQRGGILIIKVPNYACTNKLVMGQKWCGYRFPEHVNYFTPKTLRNLLKMTGFKKKRFLLRDRSPISDNMWIIAIK